MTQTLTNKELLAGMRNKLPKDDFKPDPWQKKTLEHEGNITLRCGRQSGKTETISRKVKQLAQNHNDQSMNILIAAPSKNQSAHAYKMTYDHLLKEHWFFVDAATEAWIEEYPQKKLSLIVKKQLERAYGLFQTEPTKSEIVLKGKDIGRKPLERWGEGSRILSMPVGKTGVYIRCKTLDVLVGEEAAYIPEAVWTALLPMLSVSQKTRGFGWQILLSTPFGKGGHFHDSHYDKDFMRVHVSAEDCPRIGREFLRKERARLSKTEYAQEYLAEFVESFDQFFATDLIKQRMTFMGWDYDTSYKKENSYYLGSDIARFGKDENAFCTGEMTPNNNKHLKIINAQTSERKSIPQTARHHELLNDKYNYNKIFIDSAGVGGGVHDILVENLGKHKIRGMENASRSEDDSRKGRILKEDMYSNALRMMESGEVEIINDMALMRSLKNIRFEYTKEKHILIYGKDSHLAEAFVRVCWAQKEKGLRLFLA